MQWIVRGFTAVLCQHKFPFSTLTGHILSVVRLVNGPLESLISTGSFRFGCQWNQGPLASQWTVAVSDLWYNVPERTLQNCVVKHRVKLSYAFAHVYFGYEPNALNVLWLQWVLSPKYFKFPFPITLTMNHMSFSGIVTFFLVRLFKVCFLHHQCFITCIPCCSVKLMFLSPSNDSQAVI
jgi:hypothetical protein